MLIRCEVEQLSYGPIQVRFPDYPDLELFFQSDWDHAAFANMCGLIPSDDPGSQEFVDANLEDITECPDDYLDVATQIN